MSRQQYERVPQRDDTISLSSIHSIPPYQPSSFNPSYNYNTGIPSSIASSQHAPSIIAPSVPSSPPPSFHTHSSPGTPRPTPSTSTHAHSNPSYAELWGVAPSTVGGETMATSNDALATIAGLKQRVEWLEESIGRLLLEQENRAANGEASSSSEPRSNCCVAFTDLSPDLERALTSGNTSNCCVTFRRNKTDSKRERRNGIVAGCMGLFLVCVMITIILTSATSGRGRNRTWSEGVRGNMEDGKMMGDE